MLHSFITHDNSHFPATRYDCVWEWDFMSRKKLGRLEFERVRYEPLFTSDSRLSVSHETSYRPFSVLFHLCDMTVEALNLPWLMSGIN